MQSPKASLLLTCLLIVVAAMGQEPEPIKVLVVGNPPNIRVVSQWLEGDPLTDPRQVPARTHLTPLQEEEIRRFIRLYFPRTYDRLIEFEYLMLVMVEIFHFTPEQQMMLHDAMYVDGRGAFQDRSVMSMAQSIANPWADSIVSDAFPNDADAVVSQSYSRSNLLLRYRVNSNPHVPPILMPYKDFEGVETSISPSTTVIAIPKDGAVVTSYVIGGFRQGFAGAYPDPEFKSPGWMPHTMYWKYGNATTWTHTDMLGGDLYWLPVNNPYSIDMLLAEMLFAIGRELPEDVVLVHFLRGKFESFSSTRGWIYSLLDFIDKFGAKDTPIVVKMEEVSERAKQGKKQYLLLDYAEATTIMDEAITSMEALRQEAMELKDRALFWVYVVEWFAVSGVSLLTGFALWSLMVRRRLYREVKVTRMITAE